MDADAVLAKKRGRGVSTTLRPFPVGRYHLLLNLKLSFRVQSYPRRAFFIKTGWISVATLTKHVVRLKAMEPDRRDAGPYRI